MIDLTAALESYYATHDDARGDEAEAHVSDLYGCDLATWARRSGKPMLPFDTRTRMKFAMGNQVEDHVATVVAESLQADGWTLERDIVVTLNGTQMVGHADYVFSRGVERLLVECKSTSFLRGKAPLDASDHYKLQAAGYAVALNCARFGIFIVCRESGRVAEFWYDTAEFIGDVEQRLAEVLRDTDPAREAPAPNPRYGWSCRTCGYAACSQNKNPAAESAA